MTKKVKNEALDVSPIYLVILNITSWVGQCPDATHLYGKLILCEDAAVTIDNVCEYNVNHLGKTIELKRPLTLELAKELDRKSGGNTYERAYQICNENPEIIKDMEYYGYTEKFDTISEVVSAGIAKWNEPNINCPFISLYEGEKYEANSYESTSTAILQYRK